MKMNQFPFFCCHETLTFEQLPLQIIKIDGVAITGILTDNVVEIWLDFDFHGASFSVNNQFGEFWFFAESEDCSDDILSDISRHLKTVMTPNNLDTNSPSHANLLPN